MDKCNRMKSMLVVLSVYYMNSLREGSQKNGHFMVFDHTPLTPPPEHIYSPLVANFFNNFFSARNGTYNIINGFLLKKKSILLTMCKLEVDGR